MSSESVSIPNVKDSPPCLLKADNTHFHKNGEVLPLHSMPSGELETFVHEMGFNSLVTHEAYSLYSTRMHKLYSPRTFEIPQMLLYVTESKLLVLFSVASNEKFTFNIGSLDDQVILIDHKTLVYVTETGSVYRCDLASNSLLGEKKRSDITKLIFGFDELFPYQEAEDNLCKICFNKKTGYLVIVWTHCVCIHDLKGNMIQKYDLSTYDTEQNAVVSVECHPKYTSKIVINTREHISVLELSKSSEDSKSVGTRRELRTRIKARNHTMDSNMSDVLFIGEYLFYTGCTQIHFYDVNDLKVIMRIDLPVFYQWESRIFFVREIDETEDRKIPKDEEHEIETQDSGVSSSIVSIPKRFIFLKSNHETTSSTNVIEVDMEKKKSRILYTLNISNIEIILPRGKDPRSPDYKYPHALTCVMDIFHLYPIKERAQNYTDASETMHGHLRVRFYTLEQTGRVSGTMQNVTNVLVPMYEEYLTKELRVLDLTLDLRKIIVKFL